MKLNTVNKPHKCAAIFIDNSGVDVILGILPFVEHLLSRGTEVCFHVPRFFEYMPLLIQKIRYIGLND